MVAVSQFWLNAIYFEQPLPAAKAADADIGKLCLTYHVREVVDVQGLGNVRAFEIDCKQRVLIYGACAGGLPPTSNKYHDYPAAIAITMTPSPLTGVRVLGYSPRTLNTTVSTSLSNTDGSGSSFSLQHTTGSSVAQTNSYDVSASLGMTGEAPSMGISGGYGHSTTLTYDTSNTSGVSNDRNRQLTGSQSMSLKDWATYGALQPDQVTAGWLWAQEYPWNVLAFNTQGKDSVSVPLPQYIFDRLFPTPATKLSGTVVAAPSELSLFGLDFTSSCKWLVEVQSPGPDNETMTVTHAGTYYTASHGLAADSTPMAQMMNCATISVTGPVLDLPLLGLEPIRANGVDNGAVLGFTGSQLITPPAGATQFRARSNANNLYVLGSGFKAPLSGDDPLYADFSDGAVTLTVYAKVGSLAADLALYVKHWSRSAESCVMSVVVNGSTVPLIRHVDAQEFGSGSDNLTVIALRSIDHEKGEYYDYLQPGLNTLTITISASKDNSAPSAGYALRALAIG